MARFNSRPLAVLDGIYRFVGGLRSSSRVDIESPITLVHDVSREAERAMGFFQLNQAQSLVVPLSTTDYSALTRAAILSAAEPQLRLVGLAPETTDVWWMRTWATIDDADDNLGAGNPVGVALVQGSENFVNDDGQVLFQYTSIQERATAASPRQLSLSSGGQSIQPSTAGFGPNILPLRMIPGNNTAIWLRLTSSAGGDLSVTARHVFWFGPEGVTPPPYAA